MVDDKGGIKGGIKSGIKSGLSTTQAESSPGQQKYDESLAIKPSAIIGPKIRIKGELVGEEDLLIQGPVEGTIDLKDNYLTIGKEGVLKANASAKIITIEGDVEGDLFGEERIVILKSSNVRGNLVADRVSLEDGAKFRGSIDMDVEAKNPDLLKPKFSQFAADSIESEEKLGSKTKREESSGGSNVLTEKTDSFTSRDKDSLRTGLNNPKNKAKVSI